MKVTIGWVVWFRIWILFVFSIGIVSSLAFYLKFDPFLFERYFSFAIALFFWGVLFTKKSVNFRVVKSWDIFCLMLFTCWVFLRIESDQLAPVGFFLFFLIIYFFQASLFSLRDKFFLSFLSVSKNLYFLVCLVLLLMLVSGREEFYQLGDRFVGFFASPTTFATWMVALYIISFSDVVCGFAKQKRSLLLGFVAFFMLFLFVYFSGTRVNLVFLLLLVTCFLFRGIFLHRRIRFLMLVLYAVAIFSIYPLYGLFAEYFSSELIAYRYESGVDASFGLRSILFSSVFGEVLESGIFGLFFGQGGESSRNLIVSIWGVDVLPHNDIVRILHDYGAIFCVAYVLFIARLGASNYISMLAALLYMTAFVHNMIYSHYLIVTLVVFSEVGIFKSFLRRES